MNRVRAFILIISLTAILAGASVTGYYMYQNSGDHGRFMKIKHDCINTYDKDTANGNRYLVYPCSDKTLRLEFSNKYGYEYPY